MIGLDSWIAGSGRPGAATRAAWMPRCGAIVIVAAFAGLAPLVTRAATLVPLTVPSLWGRGEWRLDGAPVAGNNFDPDQIRIDAVFAAPSGRRMRVPAFWFRDYTRSLADGKQVLAASGEPHWRVRFTPDETGTYDVVVMARTAGESDEAALARARFEVVAGSTVPMAGWTRVARDRASFASSSGAPLRLIGANVCWGGDRGTFSYDDWFAAMRGAGENFARLWMAPWSMGLEHAPGTLNRYDLAGAWELDAVLREAERSGIHVVLAMDHHGMFMVNDPAWGGSNNFWVRNSPYAAENGGPCASPNEFFTRNDARILYKKRLRYLIGRYGYSPYLLSWQFFNEIDNAYRPRSDLVAEDVAAWHRDMAQWLHAHDPYAHLVSTSLTGASDRPELWTLPEMDFAVYHAYGEADPAVRLAALSADFVRRYAKPVMIGEFGTSFLNWNIAADPYLRGFRQGLWGGALGGSVGTSMSWWWEDLHADRAYPLYGVVHDVMERAGWSEPGWSPAAIAGAPPQPDALGPVAPDAQPFSAAVPLNQLRLNAVAGSALFADPLSVDRASERLSAYLHGSRNPRLQQHARMTAWFAPGARLTFRVNSVASSANLVVRIDDAEVFRTSLADKDGLAALNDEINQDYSVELPAGRHTVMIAHDGEDWVNLKSLRLERLLPSSFAGGWEDQPAAVGLRRGNAAAVVYVRSPYVAWPAGALRFNPPTIAGARVSIADWSGGPARVSWIDPADGREVATATVEVEAGRLVLSPPEFNVDLVGLVQAEPR